MNLATVFLMLGQGGQGWRRISVCIFRIDDSRVLVVYDQATGKKSKTTKNNLCKICRKAIK